MENETTTTTTEEVVEPNPDELTQEEIDAGLADPTTSTDAVDYTPDLENITEILGVQQQQGEDVKKLLENINSSIQANVPAPVENAINYSDKMDLIIQNQEKINGFFTQIIEWSVLSLGVAVGLIIIYFIYKIIIPFTR